VLSVPQGSGAPRVMIDFGTGQQFPQTNLTPTTYQGGVQSLYGVWDWNLGNWNSISTTQFLSLPSGTTAAPSVPLNSSNLQTQTLTPVVGNALDITSNVVCWAGSGTCTGTNNQFGFVTALPGVQEQIVFNPLVFQNALVVNTTIPAVNSPSSCTVQTNTGNTIAISLATGGSLGNNVTGSYFVASSDPMLAGVQTNGTGTPFAVLAGGKTFLMTQTLGVTGATGGGFTCSGKVCSTPVQAATLTSKRLTWIERR
jgi:type IV pilus assembly protein PilY1